MIRTIATIAFVISLFVCSSAQAEVIFDWAYVGNAGNGADVNGSGAVAYDYRISKHEVTNAQYTEFLNAVDPAGTDALDLYSENMGTDENGGILFESGATEGSKYLVKQDRGNNPVVFVSFFEAMRFTNWLDNGQGTGDTETGVYTIGTGVSEVRNPNASFFIPSSDEWYKAAYHKNDGTTDNYWKYATSTNEDPYSDQPPGSDAPDSSNIVNFYLDDVDDLNGFNDGYAVTGSAVLATDQNYLTDVGAYASTLSPYGTYDQSGNVYELTEMTIGPIFRNRRGGSFSGDAEDVSSFFLNTAWPDDRTAELGFRVASAVVPEPSSISLVFGAVMGLLATARRKRAAFQQLSPTVAGAAMLALLTVSSANAQLAPAYNVTDLGHLGGNTSDSGDVALGVSNSGYITGNSEQVGGSSAIFRYSTPGPMEDVGIFGGGLGASGRDINDFGTIVGVSGDLDNGPFSPARARLGEPLEDLGVPAGFDMGEAIGVNNNEVIVGRVEDINFSNSRPFVYTDSDGYQILGTLGGTYGGANAISESGVVVGFSGIAGGGTLAFRVTPDALGNYPALDPAQHMLPALDGASDSPFTNALSVSPNGQFIVGGSQAADQNIHGFIYDPINGIRDLGLLPTMNFAFAGGVNSHGVVVGFGNLTDSNGSFTERVAWAWSEKQGIVQLDDYLASTSSGLWRIERTHAINDSGQIVGSGYNLLDGTQHALLLTPVPEPSSLGLLACAALGRCLASRRRQR